MPFILEHGSKSLYRGWNEFGPTWVSDIADAIQYARRVDAEAQHAEDEDAAFIREVDDDNAIIFPGPYGVTQLGEGKRWSIFRSKDGRIIELLEIGEAVPEQEAEMVADICAAALNRSLPYIKQMRDKHNELLTALIQQFSNGAVTAELHVQPPVSIAVQELTATNLTPKEVLMLFYEFVAQNVTQWKMGAGDPHHPVWALTANILDGKPPITEGFEWAFIQPENRASLKDLQSGAVSPAEQ